MFQNLHFCKPDFSPSPASTELEWPIAKIPKVCWGPWFSSTSTRHLNQKNWWGLNSVFDNTTSQKVGAMFGQCEPKVQGRFAFPSARKPLILSISRFRNKFTEVFLRFSRSSPEETPSLRFIKVHMFVNKTLYSLLFLQYALFLHCHFWQQRSLQRFLHKSLAKLLVELKVCFR